MANKIYDILIQLAGALEIHRQEFVDWFDQGCLGREYRFGGKFIGAKFWNNSSESWRISCYQEQETEETTKELLVVNEKMEELWQFFLQDKK